MNKAITTSILILLTNISFAQTAPLMTCSATEQRATERYWFAGDKIAIDFGTSGNSYNITTNASTVSSVGEGSTVVTDTNGNLQFWAGQSVIYNRSQQPMLNGTGLTSNNSAVQAAAAFSSISNPDLYFAVTTTGLGSMSPTLGNLYYSVIDMAGDSGNGEVTTKNILVPGTTGMASEALTAIPTNDGLGYWVLTTQYGSSNFVAVRFDENGPVGTPVTTALSQPIGNVYQAIYANPDLTRLIVINGDLASRSGNYAHLLSFNAATGQATELASWQVPILGTADPNIASSGNRTGYAGDFSPSGDYVYISQIYPGQLWRYNVSSENSATIASTEEFIGNTGPTAGGGGGHVRRGPDGAMWVANLNSNFLTRIPNPDAATAAGTGFSLNNVALPAGSSSRWGLPQMVTGCPKLYTPNNVADPKAIPSLSTLFLAFLGTVLIGLAAVPIYRRKFS